jgi:cytidyltransferase-like protein
VTNGHLDIISRAAQLYDEVVVAVGGNPAKSSLFSADERVELIREVTQKLDNVRVDLFEGLIVDFCRSNDISAIVKGLRAVSDFDYEMQMAQMNYSQAGVEPGEGVRQVRRGRKRPGPGYGAGTSDEPAGRNLTICGIARPTGIARPSLGCRRPAGKLGRYLATTHICHATKLT